MKPEVLEQVQDAIENRYYTYDGTRNSLGSLNWKRPIRTQGDYVVMLWGDCGNPDREEDLYLLDEEKWVETVEKSGLYKKVGMWDFVSVNDPALKEKELCRKNPEGAGRLIYELQKENAKLKERNKPGEVVVVDYIVEHRNDVEWVQTSIPFEHEDEARNEMRRVKLSNPTQRFRIIERSTRLVGESVE